MREEGGVCRVKIVIEFYRTRAQDDAHAVVGRETCEASNLDEAIAVAQSLSATLNMPQFPDCVSISDAEGNRLYSGQLGANDNPEERISP
jgi:hypothetical protein